MTTIYLEADMPDEEVASFLQMIRKWDGGLDHHRMAIKIGQTGLGLRELTEIFNSLCPDLPFKVVMVKTDE